MVTASPEGKSATLLVTHGVPKTFEYLSKLLKKVEATSQASGHVSRVVNRF